MALDIVGPANAPNATTIRPTDTRAGAFGATDTWMKDCTSSSANDGTKLQAGFMNSLIAQVRNLIRGNGLTGSSQDVVTLDNSDDTMLLKAVQNLIQRGQPIYSDDSGTANNVVVTLTPTPKEYKKGMLIVAKIAADSTGISQINANGLGGVTIKHFDLSDIGAKDMLGGSIQAFVYDGTYFQLAWSQRQPGAPIYLQAPTTFYVNASTGSDTNDGLAATVGGGHGPFATIQKAANQIPLYNSNGFTIQINVADAPSYTQVNLPKINGSGQVRITGNTTTPTNCVITGTNSSAIIASGAALGSYTIEGFKLTASGAAVGDAIAGVNVFGGGTSVTLGNMNFGTCLGAHMTVGGGATLSNLPACQYAISGGCAGNINAPGCFIYAFSGGEWVSSPAGGPNIVVQAAVTFAGAFVEATITALFALLYASLTGAANVTGQRYLVTQNAIMQTGGGGPNYWPGTVAGANNTGGQYS